MKAIFDYGQYMPHGMCLLWEPWLVMLWAGSDLMIFTAYMAIPLALLMVLRRRPDLNHRALVSLFAAFILLCGVTHFMGIVTLWYPIYPITGAVKLATGLVSLATAAMLFRLIPVFVRIPTPETHDEVIAQLEATLADLSHTRDELELRVKQRTAELKRANSDLAFTARNAVHRTRNLLQIVSSLIRPGVESAEPSISFLQGLRGRINALMTATSTVMDQNENTGASLERVIRRQIEPFFDNPATQLSTEGPMVAVGAQGAQQISLVAWELCSRFTQIGRNRQLRGRIRVSWSVEQQMGEEDQLVLEWCESFIPLAVDHLQTTLMGDGTETPAPVEEFSETLLTRIVPRLLDGRGRIHVEGSTFLYRLTCPLSALENSHMVEMAGFGEDEFVPAALTETRGHGSGESPLGRRGQSAAFRRKRA